MCILFLRGKSAKQGMGSLDEFVRDVFVDPIIKSPLHILGASFIGGIVGLGAGMEIAATVPAYLTYAGLNAVRGYKDKQPLMKRNAHSIPERVTEFFVENPTISGLCTGGYIAATHLVAKCLQYQTAVMDLPNNKLMEVGFAGAMAGFTGDLGMRAIRSMRRIKTPKKEKSTVAAIVVDKVVEHPIEIGALTALANLPHIIQKIPNAVDPPGREVYLLDYMRDVPFIAAMTFGITASVVAGLGTVAHSTSRSFIGKEYGKKPYYRLRKYFARGEGEKKQWVEKVRLLQEVIVRDAADLETRIEQEVVFGDLEINERNMGQAFEHYRRAARLLTHKGRGQIAPYKFFKEWIGARDYKGNLFPKTDEEAVLKGFQGLLHGNKRALWYWKEVYERNKTGRNGEEYAILYARGLGFVGKRKEGDALMMELAGKAFREEGMQGFSRLSKNKVGKLRNKMLKTELIVKEGEIAMLEREKVLTESAALLFAERADYFVPKIVGLDKNDTTGILVEEIVEGQDLYDLMSKGMATPEELYPVSDALAFFQANTDMRNLGKERDDAQVTVDRYRALGYSEDNIELLRFGLRPILQSMEGTEKVAMKDAQPENVRIGEEGICLLDWEGVRPSSIVVDLANLLDYVSPMEKKKGLVLDEKLGVVHHFLDRFSSYRGERLLQKREEYDLAYLNAVILRTLQWRPTLYPRQREDPLRATFEHTVEALGVIKERFSGYFQKYKKEYGALNSFLQEIRMKELVL